MPILLESDRQAGIPALPIVSWDHRFDLKIYVILSPASVFRLIVRRPIANYGRDSLSKPHF